MKQKFFGSKVLATSSAGTVFTHVFSPAVTSATESGAVFPATGTLRNLYVALTSDPDSGASGKGYRFTLRYASGDGALGDSALTCNVLSSTANFRNSDVTHEVSVTAGDKVSLQIALVDTPANSPTFSFIMEFEGTTSGESVLLGRMGGGSLGTTTTVYMGVGGQGAAHATVEAQTYTIMPCSGTITKFWTRLPTSPGSGKTRTFNLRINGADASGGATVAYANETGIKSSADTTVSVSAGDLVNAICVTTGVTPSSSNASIGVVFVPTVAGNFPITYGIPGSTGNQLSATAVRYVPVGGGDQTISVTEASTSNILYDDFVIKLAYAWLDVAPGASKSYTFVLRKDADASSTPYTITFDDNSQGPKVSSASDYTPTQWSLYNTRSTPASTPAAARLIMSYLGYIATAGATPVTSDAAGDDWNAL